MRYGRTFLSHGDQALWTESGRTNKLSVLARDESRNDSLMMTELFRDSGQPENVWVWFKYIFLGSFYSIRNPFLFFFPI